MNLDLQSLGHAAATYQRDPRAIRAALRVVQAEAAVAVGKPIPPEACPALTLNGVPYFPADEIVKAIGTLAESDAENARRSRDKYAAVSEIGDIPPFGKEICGDA
ncbi:MAG: hypothetical protein GX594_09580 [Pirellulaceae bacterium]|nr:hypothetical protein [Pirellulaceae bacterium]